MLSRHQWHVVAGWGMRSDVTPHGTLVAGLRMRSGVTPHGSLAAGDARWSGLTVVGPRADGVWRCGMPLCPHTSGPARAAARRRLQLPANALTNPP
eukprot:364547-Chlamydomonas_euryale.AAC.4